MAKSQFFHLRSVVVGFVLFFNHAEYPNIGFCFYNGIVLIH